MQKYLNDLPAGDLLIHSGDSTMGGSLDEMRRFAEWLAAQKYDRKIVVAGNHDFGYNNNDREAVENMIRDAGATYLRDSSVEIEGVRFWGSPWTPFFHDWAFNVPRGEEIAAKWNLIPEDTNVLITHGPPHGILDMTNRGVAAGCEMLLERVMQLNQLKYHIFGHIHEGYGTLERNGKTFVNACTCTARYAPTNNPIVIEL